MIEICGLTKRFGKVNAVDNMTVNIPNGAVVGLVGSNGSGKSTLLRMLAGVYAPDGGTVKVDGIQHFDNPVTKGECFFIPDFPYFYNTSTVESTAFLYRRLYPNWSEQEYNRLCSIFPININAPIINMSKGMQRQAALILALSTCPKYLFLDEIFDCLDPVVRHMLKSLLAEKVADNKTTVVIASHNLRELEDLCDRLCLMHRGHMMLERGIDDLRHGLRKVQVAFTELPYKPNIFEGINAINITRNGNIFNLTIKGTEEEFMPKLKALNPAFVSAIPLTLEEIFISEMGAAGYDIHSIL